MEQQNIKEIKNNNNTYYVNGKRINYVKLYNVERYYVEIGLIGDCFVNLVFDTKSEADKMVKSLIKWWKICIGDEVDLPF